MVRTVSLTTDRGDVGKISEMEKAKVGALKADTISRALLVVVIAGIFIGLNWAVIDFVRTAFAADMELLGKGTIKATERVVSTNVFMSLIGATIVQVGIAIIAIVNYLFPKNPGTDQSGAG